MKVGIRICIAALITGLVILACSPNEQQQRTLENSTPETVDLLVSLGGSSRAERFLGTFDEINKLTLDLKRNFDNREVVTGFALTRDNTSRWSGTLNNLIITFEYTVTGHAYKCTDCDNGTAGGDNNTYLEIFRGETQHTVTSGTNALSLRLTPLLDDRELTVPRITRINRPFQLEKTDNASISVAVSNSDLQALQFRFRSVDADTSLPLSEAEGGGFSPDKGTHEADNSSYPDLATTYTAPDLISVQNLQVRVSNDLEIGVTASFKTYVTGPIDSQTTVNTNPVVETISGERAGDNELKWTVLVSDDDPFDTLVASWTYQNPETGATRTFDNSTYVADNSTTRSDVGVGLISSIMHGYQDSDAGMLRVTICETNYTNHTGSCVHGQEGSTSVDLELVAGAYQQPIICDGDSCDGLQNSSTLSQLRSRGKLRCGVNTGLEGFSKVDDAGNWTGFDVDLCRAVAVATLGDKNSVEFIPLSGGERFEAVDNGSVDMLSRNTTWSLLRDSSLGVSYAGINFYDGQSFIVRSSSQIETVEDLNGKTICVNGNSRLQNNIENYFSLIQVSVVIDNTSSNNG